MSHLAFVIESADICNHVTHKHTPQEAVGARCVLSSLFGTIVKKKQKVAAVFDEGLCVQTDSMAGASVSGQTYIFYAVKLWLCLNAITQTLFWKIWLKCIGC